MLGKMLASKSVDSFSVGTYSKFLCSKRVWLRQTNQLLAQTQISKLLAGVNPPTSENHHKHNIHLTIQVR